VNGITVNIGSAKSAAIDTGTTLIAAPSAAVTSIWSAVPGAKPLSGENAGFWSFRSYFSFSLDVVQSCVEDLIPSVLSYSVYIPSYDRDFLWGALVADQQPGYEPWPRRRRSMCRCHYQFEPGPEHRFTRHSGVDCWRHIPSAFFLFVR
jgi:hypothetical protein